MSQALPLYELKINESKDAFVDCIALVDDPAIESDFFAFGKMEMLEFKAEDDKMELIGAAMIPDMHIYRRGLFGDEYNVFFSKETIRHIAQVYMKRGFQNKMNLDHTEVPADSYIFQSYIVDEAKGIHSPKQINAPDGSWIIGVKVESQEVWKDIKSGKRKGFSVEGLFESFEQEMINEDDELIKTLAALNTILSLK